MAKSALTGLEEPWDHVEFDNSYDQQEAQRRSARDKHPTEKGFEYILNLRRQSAIAAKRSWRKQINLIHSLLVTQKDIATLTAGCEELEKKMTLFGESHEALEAIINDEEERKLVYEDFEVISSENNGVLRMISEKIVSRARARLEELNYIRIDQNKQDLQQIEPQIFTYAPSKFIVICAREEGPT